MTVDSLPDCRKVVGMLAGELLNQLAAGKQVLRSLAGELVAEHRAECTGSQHRDIQQVGIDGVVVVAFLA